MRDVLLLRLDAPLMSFGGAVVDNRGPVRDFPGLAMLTGLLANALGYDHRETAALSALQRRISYGARCDRLGVKVTDFQTVDLGQPSLVGTGWTTRGRIEERGKGDATTGTHIRYRDYWADAVYTVALALTPPEVDPDLDRLEHALRAPARPLFLGRKPCLPAVPVLFGRTRAPSLLDALRSVPRIPRVRWRSEEPEPLAAWVPGEEGVGVDTTEIALTDERDWENQIVVGRRLVKATRVSPPEATDAT
jgi:CRISPR system Cascade subunit CasD